MVITAFLTVIGSFINNNNKLAGLLLSHTCSILGWRVRLISLHFLDFLRTIGLNGHGVMTVLEVEENIFARPTLAMRLTPFSHSNK
jgi:hypothetical protein